MAKKEKESEELTVEDVDEKKLLKMVKALNETELADKIKVKNVDIEDVFNAFVETIDEMSEKNAKKLPKDMLVFYNNIIDGNKKEESSEDDSDSDDDDEDDDEDDDSDSDDDEDEKSSKKNGKKSKDDEDDDDDEEEEKSSKKKGKKSKDDDDEDDEDDDSDSDDDDEDEKSSKKKGKKSKDDDDEDDDDEEEEKSSKKKGKKDKDKKKSKLKDDDKSGDDKNMFGFKEGSPKAVISEMFLEDGTSLKDAVSKVEKKFDKEGIKAVSFVFGVIKKMIKGGAKVEVDIKAKAKKK